jgi:outer membrane receptor protein involved in Fe transport
MRNSRYLSALALAPVLIAVLARPALADQAATPAADAPASEIVVTATRKAEALSKVPISITAFSREALDQRGVRNFDDVIRQTPGLVIDKTNTTTDIAIRGISSSVGYATTAVYIDDVPIQVRSLGYGGGNVYPQVFDLSRIEVLRGPQGTLFGAGSEGGTVRFITDQPDLTRPMVYARGELAATQYGAPSGEIGVSVSEPIVKDSLAALVSGYYRHDGGYIDRVTPCLASQTTCVHSVVDRNANRDDSYVFRGALVWQAAPDLKITPSFFFQQVNQNDTDDTWEALSNYSQHQFADGNPVQGWGRDKFSLASLNVDYTAAGFDVIAVGSYFDRTDNFQRDYTTFDQSVFTGVAAPEFPGQAAPAAFTIGQKNWTGELRLQSNRADSPVSWTIGAFYSHDAQVSYQNVVDPYAPLYLGFPGVTAPVPGYEIYLQNATSIDEQEAVFGQVTWKLASKLSVIAGLRYTHTKFSIVDDASGLVTGPPVHDVGAQTGNPLTPKFGVNFQATPDTLVYASASRGFRVGGYNPQVGTGCAAQLTSIGYPEGRPETYGSDTVWSYEAGAKTRIDSGRGNLQASVYRIDWNNIQQAVGLLCGFQFTANLGSARSEGFDVHVDFKLVPAVTIGADLGYVDARFLQTIAGGPTSSVPLVSSGDHLTTPPWTVSLHGQYDFDLFGPRSGYVRSDFDYRAHQTSAVPYLNPADISYSNTLATPPNVYYWSMRAGARVHGIDASVFVNNILGSTAWLRRDQADNPFDYYREQIMRPRTAGITLSYRY